MPFFKILKIVWSFLIDGIRNQIIINPAYATNFPAELHKSHKRIQLSKFQTDIIINILDYLQGTGKILTKMGGHARPGYFRPKSSEPF